MNTSIQVHATLSPMAAWRPGSSLRLCFLEHDLVKTQPKSSASGFGCLCMMRPCSGKFIRAYQGLSRKNLGGTSFYVSAKWGQETEFLTIFFLFFFFFFGSLHTLFFVEISWSRRPPVPIYNPRNWLGYPLWRSGPSTSWRPTCSQEAEIMSS